MKKYILLILTLSLTIISALIIIINGKVYNASIKIENYDKDITDLKVVPKEKNIIKISDVKVDNNTIYVKIKSLSSGKVFIDFYNGDDYLTFIKVYVHKFGVITRDTYLGSSTGDRAIPISITIILLYLLISIILIYIKSMKKNIYQYKNVLYLGLIIFVALTFLNQLFPAFINKEYFGLINTIDDFIHASSLFSIILFPIAFIIALLIIISSIVLIKREGFSIKKLYGLGLGIFICYMTIFPDMLYSFLTHSNIIDINNQNSIYYYILEFINLVIYTSISYIECVLLGTIILTLKAGRNIPKFDKDYIIILGCKINKDKTLPPLLKGRVDRAIEFAHMQKDKANKDIIFIPSGGKGSDEVISEAEAMEEYLIKNGIKKKNIIIENKSKNTLQNISNSINLINDKEKNVAFSTTNYHVFRAGVLASNKKIYIEGIGSKTKSYFFINAFIREFVATIVTERKRHIKILLIIFLISIILVMMLYFGNVL